MVHELVLVGMFYGLGSLRWSMEGCSQGGQWSRFTRVIRGLFL